jgi:muconolactone D-isomerase
VGQDQGADGRDVRASRAIVRAMAMEYLIDFRIRIPDDAPDDEVRERQDGEVTRVAELAREGHALRVWRPLPVPEDGSVRVFGLYRADSDEHLREILDSLPLAPWFETTITALEEHPNDPARLTAA